MAWLESKGERFRIRFRFGGRKCLLTLKCCSQREADDCLHRFEEHIRLIDRGLVEPPPESSDIGIYILSGGKRTERLTTTATQPAITLAKLFDDYLTLAPKGVKETSTLMNERNHINHLRRIIGNRTRLCEVTSATLQSYIDSRLQEPGRYEQSICPRTVKKELATFGYVWNQFGLPRGYVAAAAPTGRLIFAKERCKPPFQTRQQIERQLARGTLTVSETAELWSSLFLTLPEIDELLDHPGLRNGPSYVQAMIAFAAHTGARRSEILRSRIDDIDLELGLVHIREKKRDTSKVETFRSVPLSTRLAGLLREWLPVHPGGIHTFATRTGQPITRQWATELLWNALKETPWVIVPGWHCFRHSFISNSVAKGIDQRLIDQWVGHSTEAMRKRYTHLIPAVSQSALLSVFS